MGKRDRVRSPDALGHRHGGHALGSYVQVPYTWRYLLLEDAIKLSEAPTRPPRRCIVEQTYADSIERVITVQGTQNHGSMPTGRMTNDGRGMVHSEWVGPWLYDAIADTWEHTRTLDSVSWPRRLHSHVTYDSTSDAVVGLGQDALYLYVPHANRVVRRSLPESLHRRLFFAMAFDPGTRRLVVFGGSTGSFLWGTSPDSGDDCNPRTAAGLAQCRTNYNAQVRHDTWVDDVEGDVWHEVFSSTHPPRGLPGVDFLAPRLVYHPPSNRLILHQTPVDRYVPFAEAPPTELWAFDAASETWEGLSIESPVAHTGLLTYAEPEDVLVLWGGGDDGSSGRPALSRHLYVLRLDIRGVSPVLAEPYSLTALATGSGVALSFAGQAGQTYEIGRAVAEPVPGAYTTIATVSAIGTMVRWVDPSAVGTAAHAYRVRRVGAGQWSLPVFDRPLWPSHVVAAVQSINHVTLRWQASSRDDVMGYHVYRSRFGGSWTRLTSAPLSQSNYDDLSIDLEDGVVRGYYVTVVDRDGRESGRSPSAYTFPDAPAGFRVEQLDGGRAVVHWIPVDPEHDRIQVWYQNYHCNAQGAAFDPYLDSYVPVTTEPLRGTGITVSVPTLDPTSRAAVLKAGCPSLREGHYYYARVVNELGQPGFWSDIISTTDDNFIAAHATP